MAYPIILLVALLALLGSGFGGYRYGKHVCQGEQATVVAAAQKQAIASANRDVETATARAVEQAKAEAAARLRSTRVRLEGERDAALKSRPECARDLDSQRLLQSAIDLANGATPAGNGVPDPVPAATTTDKR